MTAGRTSRTRSGSVPGPSDPPTSAASFPSSTSFLPCSSRSVRPPFDGFEEEAGASVEQADPRSLCQRHSPSILCGGISSAPDLGKWPSSRRPRGRCPSVESEVGSLPSIRGEQALLLQHFCILLPLQSRGLERLAESHGNRTDGGEDAG